MKLCGLCSGRQRAASREGKIGFILCGVCSRKQQEEDANAQREANESRRKVVYIAHPLRGADPDDTVRNRKRASLLVAQIASERNVAPVASWIILSEHWSEETGRELGLIIDKALIEVCEELWIIGPVRPLSAGMQIEVDHAKAHGVFVVNLQGIYE